MQSLQGQLLVASPHLAQSDFARTVILLLHHAEDGAVGVVLNRPSRETIGSLLSKIGRQTLPNEQPVNLGGPVDGPVMVLQHYQGSDFPEAAAPAQSYEATTAELGGLLQNFSGRLRVFVGHAQWAQRQLEREVQAGVWLVTPATVDLVFGDDADLWTAAVKQVGRDFYRSVLSIKQWPPDPRLN